mmetsp:Transcript_17461/g.24288  ORF Transcript_17461/g.24288 Transcript_17461/m.24288 type:complete len:125 (-) Transcript_17461:680-1054(-)
MDPSEKKEQIEKEEQQPAEEQPEEEEEEEDEDEEVGFLRFKETFEKVCIDGKYFDPPEADCSPDEEDGEGVCYGSSKCPFSHFRVVCHVCGVAYGEHNGHDCPVGGTIGDFSDRNGGVKPAKRS